MFSVNLHEFKPIQAMDCINLNMIIHKYELLPCLIGAVYKYDPSTLLRIVGQSLGCRKLVLLGIFNLPVFDFTKYDVYYLLDLRNCAEI